MYLPFSTLLFLLSTFFIIKNIQNMVLISLTILLFLVFALVSIEHLLHKKEKRVCLATMPFLLGYTVIFLATTFSTIYFSLFSPYYVLYNTLALVLYGFVLSAYISSSTKNLFLLGVVSSVTYLISLLFLPFSLLLLCNTFIPFGGLLFESLKRKRDSSMNRYALQSMLAHEIRTPLTIMQTTSSLLMEEIPGPLNSQQQTFVNSNYEYTQRLITFSENMLMLLKFEKEFNLNKKEEINIRLVTQDIVAFFKPLLKIKGQNISYTFPALLHTPLGDETLIRQVFINLVHNAVKHTKEGGYILISVTQDDEQVVVSISDNGTGVEDEERENLFREFYQEYDKNEQFQDGFGLGLSIARQIIQKHGGRVYITGVKNKGTIVSFTLPAKAIR